MLIGEVLDEHGTADDFIGHVGGDNYIVITDEEAAERILDQLQSRFADEIQTHYNFLDRDKGYITATNESGETDQIPMMTLSAGIVKASKHQFADIREITELAADARRNAAHYE
jgi:GGDEF domain-containing protein